VDHRCEGGKVSAYGFSAGQTRQRTSSGGLGGEKKAEGKYHYYDDRPWAQVKQGGWQKWKHKNKRPTNQQTNKLTHQQTNQPTNQPTNQLTNQPTNQPTNQINTAGA
jgi:hypothetical protein